MSQAIALSSDMTMPARADDDLVARLARGEAGAVAQVYDAHHAALRVFARRLIGDDGVAEDLVHDTFVALPSAMRGFRGDATIRTFLMSIAVNRARKHIRSATRRRAAMARYADQASAAGAGPDSDVARRQLAAALYRALDALPHDQRVAFVLCEVDELTSVAAARVIGCPEETVRTRLFHARKKLRARLEAEGVR